MQSFGPAFVAMCLPLSAMWASAANTGNIYVAEARPIPVVRGKSFTSSDASGTTLDDKEDV